MDTITLSSENLSAKYRVNVYTVLKLMFDVAVLNRFMKSNPVIPKLHRPAMERKKKHVWSVDQGKAILSAVEYVFRAPLMVLELTGILAGELLALRWANIDFLRKRISITHSLYRGKLQSMKSESSDREIGMSNELERILMEHRSVSQFKGDDDFVFCQADGSPLDPDSLRRCGLYPALEAAGVQYVKRASGCHALRHLVGSIIHKETGSLKDAGEQLGHADISTTGNIYVHVDDEQINRNAEILGRVLGTCGKSVVNPGQESARVQ